MTSSGSANLAYQRSPKVLWRIAGDRALLLHRDETEVVTIGGSGAVLWRLLAEPISLDDAAGALAELYDLPARELLADIEPVFAELAERGLVELVPARG
jgi:hypothetical protein